jgi:hypothetical protein
MKTVKLFCDHATISEASYRHLTRLRRKYGPELMLSKEDDKLVAKAYGKFVAYYPLNSLENDHQLIGAEARA